MEEWFGRALAARALGASPDFDMEREAQVVLLRGSIRIMNVQWLLQRPSGYTIERRQDIPVEAFLEPWSAARLLDSEGALAMLSYPWLTKSHPDPQGQHMTVVLQFLKRRLAEGLAPQGVFWDYAALPQEGAGFGSVQEATRRDGLLVMHRLYGSSRTSLIQLTTQTPGARPYWSRGWCLFEATVGCLMKAGNGLCDLGSEKVLRRPPVTPPRMRAVLNSPLCEFTNGKDPELVAQIYDKFFMEVTPCLEDMDLSRGGGEEWTREMEECFIEALPAFCRLKTLKLNGRGFSEPGQLIRKLGDLHYLQKVEVQDLQVTSEAQQALYSLHEQRQPLLSEMLLPSGLRCPRFVLRRKRWLQKRERMPRS